MTIRDEDENLDEEVDEEEDDEESEDDEIPLAPTPGRKGSFIGILTKKLRNDEDCFILVTGEKGKGKSRFIIAVGERFDPRFTLRRNILFNATVERLKRMTYDLPDYALIGIDELIGLAHKNEALSKQMTALGRLIATARKHHKVTIGASPYFFELPKSLRDNYVDGWVHVTARGEAHLMLPDPSPFNKKDRWFIEETLKAWNKRIRKGGTGSVTDEEIAERLRVSPAYIGVIKYDDFKPTQKKEYLELVRQAEEEAEKAEQEGALVESKRLADYAGIIARLMGHLYIHLDLTQTQIAEIAKVAQSTVTAMLKSVGITAQTKKQREQEEALIREAADAMAPIQLPTKNRKA